MALLFVDASRAQETEAAPVPVPAPPIIRAAPLRPAPAPAVTVADSAPTQPTQTEGAPAVATTPETPPPTVNETPPPVPPQTPVESKAPPVSGWLEAQIELARRGFSSGSIDGAVGPKTRAALRAFQQNQDLPPTGELDTATRARLTLSAPAFTAAPFTNADLAALQPISKTWLGKSQQTALAYESGLELIAERFHAHPALIRQLNADIDWDGYLPRPPDLARQLLEAGAGDIMVQVMVPAVERVTLPTRAARIQIKLTDCVLQAFDASGRIIAHFPVSIGATAESRPAGELSVITAAANPNYTFDPATFPESAEAHELREQGRKLILPPGPNNPVGVAWIGLNRPGYGIHGTPSPERVGRAESHGCFRLANWDARTLLQIVRAGIPVQIEP